MLSQFFANLIFALHIFFVLFYTLVPFTDIKRHPELHILHLFTGPLLFIHWLANSNECALTHMESILRGGVEPENSFFYNLVDPIYRPTSDDAVKQFIWVVSIALWLVTLVKFIKNPCVLTDFIKTVKNGGVRPVAVERVVLVHEQV